MQNKAFSMEDLFAFLNAGVSAFHSTAAAAAILDDMIEANKGYWPELH